MSSTSNEYDKLYKPSVQASKVLKEIQALSLAKECYSMKLDLLTNATIVDDAIRFVSSKSNEKQKTDSQSSSEADKEESKEADYDEQY